MNTLTEKQNLRYELLKANNYDAKNSKACYDFVMGADEMSENKEAGKLADGIYIIDVKGNAVRFVGNDTKVENNVAYVGIVMGSRSIAVALTNAANNKDVTLTEAEVEDCGDSLYFDTYIDAVADRDGKENTENLKKQGLNKAIRLKDGEYIPSLAELYLIFLNRKELNKALAFVGGLPIGDLWYWSSTEYSATNAWRLYLGSGGALNTPKAPHQGRVRAVSAFLPLNS